MYAHLRGAESVTMPFTCVCFTLGWLLCTHICFCAHQNVRFIFTPLYLFSTGALVYKKHHFMHTRVRLTNVSSLHTFALFYSLCPRPSISNLPVWRPSKWISDKTSVARYITFPPHKCAKRTKLAKHAVLTYIRRISKKMSKLSKEEGLHFSAN